MTNFVRVCAVVGVCFYIFAAFWLMMYHVAGIEPNEKYFWLCMFPLIVGSVPLAIAMHLLASPTDKGKIVPMGKRNFRHDI